MIAASDPLPLVLIGVVGLAVVAYVLTAGADFGAGIWDLLARGPRAARHRTLIEHAIAPIWEANHIWMILVVVLLFTGFPVAFSVVAIALHIPITAALVGIVLRGTAFTFRSYGLQSAGTRRRWGGVFAWSSAVTPIFLGMTLGALSTGEIRVREGLVTTGFVAGWTTPFAIGVGIFALVLFTLLAAVYLTVDAEDDRPVQEDFRRRAIVTELLAFAVAAAVAWRASVDAPQLYAGLRHSTWSMPAQGVTAAAAVTVLVALWQRRYPLARLAVIVQVGMITVVWGLAMDGHLVMPDVTIETAGLRPIVVRPVLWILAGGSVVLAPALWFLYRVFKSPRAAT
jgi:cytochrome d ubiquinol oxidase subunit II